MRGKRRRISMSFVASLLRFLDTPMPIPTLYGWYHLMWLAIVAIVAWLLCRDFSKTRKDRSVPLVLWTSVLIIALEVYKMVNYSFSYEDGVEFDFEWYAFPFQFCSTPMYVGLLAGLSKKGKFHNALCAYLATFAVFAGACVMFYPGDVFIDTIGINVQTMVCHGSMLVIGVYLLYTGHVKAEHKTILGAGAVFLVCVILAALMNEYAHSTGLLERETFNMFFISTYCDPHLPVYSLVQGVVPFPLCLVLYVLGFSAAAYVILLAAMGITALVKKKVSA